MKSELTKLLTKQQAAELLQISERQVRRLIAEGKLKALRLGHKTVRIKPEQVERYLERG